ncbi:lipid-binding protein [uncultured Maribacter sp.]|uniref:lipid-binding protein n=1 Tax=uncultured Maribacter sp. TaxID=431308 RepID=UPI002603D330|nr:lipid-binding protein [uncultured Maribacter sp.]
MKHNIIVKKLSFIFNTILFVTSFVACEVESVPDENDVVISEVTGTWVVDMIYNGDDAGTNTISIYNTGANDTNVMWLDDQEHSWGLKAQVPLDLAALTFGGTALDELYYGVTVDITEGIIVKGGATTPSGDIVDSISFKAEFSDIPGEIWEYSGYKSTAKIEDLP